MNTFRHFQINNIPDVTRTATVTVYSNKSEEKKKDQSTRYIINPKHCNNKLFPPRPDEALSDICICYLCQIKVPGTLVGVGPGPPALAFLDNGQDQEGVERRNKMLQVVAATRTAMMVVVESYDAYVLEEYAGSTLACVHHGEEGVKENLGWGRSRQEHMNSRVTKPRETQSTLESNSSFFLFCLHHT